MKAVILMLLFAATVPAQLRETLWMDLSGEWRTTDGDRAEYARPDFDDGQWRAIQLPEGRLGQAAPHWLRRHVTLPERADRSRLALTLGTIQDIYEVYVNGRKIGESSRWDSFEGAQIPRPRTFPIPFEAVRDSTRLQIAVRIKHALFMVPTWRLPDEGPYVVTYREDAPLDAGQRQADALWFAFSPVLVFAVLYLAIGILGFAAWRSEPQRRELFWYALVAWQGCATWFYIMTQLRGQYYPFNSSGHAAFQTLLDLVQSPLLGTLALSALGYRSRVLRLALWLGWGVMPLAFWLGARNNTWTNLGNLYAAVFLLVVVTRNWWSLRGRRSSWEEHLLRLALILPALSDTEYWLSSGLGSQLFGETDWRAGSYFVEQGDVFLLALLITILALLIRKIGADRQDHLRLAGELGAARQVQQALLVKPSAHAGDPIDVVYEPAREVGGDFYQVIPIEGGGRLLLVGDVSGKGLNAAMLVSVVIGASRRDTRVCPGEMLSGLNKALTGQTGGGFVTCCAARLCPDGRLTLANAGHLAPYWNGREVELEAGLPLGIGADGEYSEATIQLAPGDQVTFLSDGVVEAANANRELFGFDRTRSISAKPAREIAEAARAWGQNDDITVVTVRRSA